jgi:glycosyltransferase involved in cell wall biosynthesis
MKVIHFITSIDKSGGGTTAYMQLLSAELKQLVELVVVTGLSINPVELKGVNVLLFDLSLLRWFRLEKEFNQLLTFENPDIVHINGIWLPQTFLFQQVAQALGIQVVLSPHGMLEPYILNRHPFKKKIALAFYQRNTILRANYIHATAQSELDQIRKLGYHQPAHIIPNGIEVGDIKQKTEWMPVRNILFLSRVHPKKGLELMIEAVAELKPQLLTITIAGEGDESYVESLQKLCTQKGVADYFQFIGGVYGDSKWKLYEESDLFILPTYSENFGIVVAEALSTGLPVITTTGTPWQELETEICGWWIDLTVANLLQALREALNCDAERLKTMGLNGRKLVDNKYGIKSVALQMRDFYETIIEK